MKISPWRTDCPVFGSCWLTLRTRRSLGRCEDRRLNTRRFEFPVYHIGQIDSAVIDAGFISWRAEGDEGVENVQHRGRVFIKTGRRVRANKARAVVAVNQNYSVMQSGISLNSFEKEIESGHHAFDLAPIILLGLGSEVVGELARFIQHPRRMRQEQVRKIELATLGALDLPLSTDRGSPTKPRPVQA